MDFYVCCFPFPGFTIWRLEEAVQAHLQAAIKWTTVSKSAKQSDLSSFLSYYEISIGTEWNGFAIVSLQRYRPDFLK